MKTSQTERSADSTVDRLNHWIGGVSSAPETGQYGAATDPRTGLSTLLVAHGNAGDVERAVAAAARALAGWRRLGSADRGRLLHRLATAIRDNIDEFIALEQSDTGKPRATALSEIEGSARYFEFYAGLVNFPVGDVLDIEADQHVFTRREPFGVVGIITPWNLPLNQAARAIAPAIVAGNVVVVKPAESTSRTSVALARIASEVGFPAGVVNVVLGEGDVAGEAIVRHPQVRKVAFTGSVRTGQAIGHIAAERIIPLTLELGGKSANIVFADADLERAAADAVRAFSLNSGQVCSAGSRLLVQRSIYDAFVATVAELTTSLRAREDVGPLITRAQFEQVQEYLALGKAEGARTAAGGRVLEGEGFFVEPTVFAEVTNDMRIAQEEIFGPVLVAIQFDDEEDAIRIANDSPFGLIGSVWTQDISRALRVAEEIEAGQVFVNVWNTMAVQTPFGGHKHSGYGREKGIEAINHYSHLKTVTIKY